MNLCVVSIYKDVPASCTRVLEIPTTVDNMILVFLAAKPSGRCDFASVLKVISTNYCTVLSRMFLIVYENYDNYFFNC